MRQRVHDDRSARVLRLMAVAGAGCLLFWSTCAAGATPPPKADGAAPAKASAPPPNVSAPPVAKVAASTAKSAAKAPAKVIATPPLKVSAAPTAKADSSMTLKGGQEGTEFRTLTVEGEDRVHVDIERPPLSLQLDPEQVPGLDQGSARDVLDRTVPDLLTPMVSLSSQERTPYLGRPWLRQFASGSVAHFKPQVRDIERWKLLIANSRGETVASYEGHGNPPKEISWDGRSKSGAPVMPGLMYSYVFEAYDRAGNKRNFVGEGFEVSAYRIDDPVSPRLVFSGKDIAGAARRDGYISGPPGAGMTDAASVPPILLEAASWANQALKLRDPIRVRAAARTRDQANGLATRTATILAARTLGDPTRIQVVSEVQTDAPADGTVSIGPAH